MSFFKKKNLIILFSLFALTILFIQPLSAANSKQNSDVKILPGKFVVKFKSAGLSKQANQPAVSRVSGQYAVHNMKQVFNEARNVEIKEHLNLNNVFIMETAKSADIWQIVNELNRNPEVEYAEPVYINEIDVDPNDPLYSTQYHLPQVFAPEAWDIDFGDSTVIIGILDSGVDWDHEDLVDVIWSNEDEVLDGTDTDGNGYIDDIRGWDFVTGLSGEVWEGEDGDDADNDPMDFDGHGTHVSGLAAAQTNNNVGIASVSSGARILPLRIGWQGADGNGYVRLDWAADAYIYAADNGAHITNQSSENLGQLIVDAALYAVNNGVLVVVSAGNTEHEPGASALGAQPWVISVAAVNQDDIITYYSAAGEYVTVSAPGGEMYIGNETYGLLSTVVYPSDFFGGDQYVKFQGTSMAAPVVASVAALLKSHEPDLNVVDLFTRIVETADDIDALNPDFAGLLGSGRVNAYRALTEQASADPNFIVVNGMIEDEAGNGNNKLDPGENVILRLTLRNWQEAEGVTASLSTNDDWPVTVNSGVVSVGDVPILSEVEVAFDISCASDALPRAIVLNLDITGTGFENNISYQVSISPQVLLIADFEGNSEEYLDFSSHYKDALNASNISFDFVHHSDTDITTNLLNNYKSVIWGCEWTFPSLDGNDRDVLEQFLDNGGSLFLSGQDIGWDLNESVDNQDVTFFNNYLKSTYVADDAGTEEIFGIEDDPISHDLALNFYQPKRASTQQFPDIIEPRESAQSILNYESGSSGAIRYSGDYRLVYFGFGGFESITDQETRKTIMVRVVNFLDGIEIVHNRLRDTEETTGEYTFKLTATADNDSITRVELHWSSDGSLPYTKVAMADSGNHTYEASIAALEAGSTVNYFIYVETETGTYAFTEEYIFNIGPDTEAPTVEMINPYISNTINAFGPAPYKFIVKIDDNLGIDTLSAQLFFSVNAGNMDSTSLSYLEKDKFGGTFSFDAALSIGDQVDYFAQVRDVSSNKNVGTSETHSFQIDTFQVIDDFEDGDWRWDLGEGWEITDSDKHGGEFSITDSPDGNYENNTSNPLTFGFPFNLSIYQFAQLEFWMLNSLMAGDSLLVEISTDNGQNWNLAEGYTLSAFSFRLRSIDLSAYTGVGNENVQIRFRLTSDADGQANGIWIDDISFKVSEHPLALEDEGIRVPLAFSLKQNYPNPFNPSTTIQYSIPKTEQVDLTIYTITGEKVKTLVSDKVEAGYHDVQWNGLNDHGISVASGVYIYRIKTKGFNKAMKMLFLK